MKTSPYINFFAISLLLFPFAFSYAQEDVRIFDESGNRIDLPAKQVPSSRHHKNKHADLKDTLSELRSRYREQGRGTYEIDEKINALSGSTDEFDREYMDKEALREILKKHLNDEEIEKMLPDQSETIGGYTRRLRENEEVNAKLISILEKEAENIRD